ncbi:unnamed protein product [Rhodiola kirilowii]
MRCRNHLYDVSSCVGVCASCLRERLSDMIDAEAHMSFAAFENRQKQHSHPPPPLLFPRSVSPYTFKRDLDDVEAKHRWMLPDRRFFSTPQYEITSASKSMKEHTTTTASKFAVITKLFKSKSQKLNKEDKIASPTSISVSTPRWFPSLRRKSKFEQSTPDQTPNSNNQRIGISPSRTSFDTPSGHPWKKKSNSSASSRRIKSTTNFTGMIFGLSPIIQPSPIRLHSHKRYTSDTAFGSFSGELMVPVKATMSTSSSLSGIRSRKPAKF